MRKPLTILVLLLCTSLLPASPAQYEAPPFGTIGPDWQFMRTKFKAKDLPPADFETWKWVERRDNKDQASVDICARYGDLAIQAHLDALTGGAGDAEHYTSILWLYVIGAISEPYGEVNRLPMQEYFYRSIRLAPTQYLLPKTYAGFVWMNFGEVMYRQVMDQYQVILDSSIVAGVDHNEFELAMCVDTYEEAKACIRSAMRKWPYDKTVAHHYDYLIAQFLMGDFWDGFWQEKKPDKLLGMLKYMMQRKLLRGNSMEHFSQNPQDADNAMFLNWSGRLVRIPRDDHYFQEGITMTTEREAMMKTEPYEAYRLLGGILSIGAKSDQLRRAFTALKTNSYWNALEEVRPGPEWW